MKLYYLLSFLVFIFTQDAIGQDYDTLDLRFFITDSTQYAKYKLSFPGYFRPAESSNFKPGSSFTLKIKNEDQKFFCLTKPTDCYSFKGEIPELHKYILYHCQGTTCSLVLLDKNTGTKQYLENPPEAEVKIPVLSTDQKKLILYTSSLVEKESWITIYTRKNTSDSFDLAQPQSLRLENFRIDELISVGPDFIAIKTYEDMVEREGQLILGPQYLIAKIKK